MNIMTKKVLESLLNKNNEIKSGRSTHKIPESSYELLKAATLIIETAAKEIEYHEWMNKQIGGSTKKVITVCLED